MLITTEEIALELKRPVKWVRENLINTGIIPSVSVGKRKLVKQSEFDAWVNGGGTEDIPIVYVANQEMKELVLSETRTPVRVVVRRRK